MADSGKEEKVVGVGGGSEKEDDAAAEEEEKLLEGMAVLDFDMLCSTVAMQSQQGKWRLLDNEGEEEGGEFGGVVLRMWEGEVLDCFDDRRIGLESLCCPCYRFGKNMRRAGFGSCFFQGTVYMILVASALFNFIAFTITKRSCFLYIGIAFIISMGTYMGFFRTRMRKKFNIKGNDSSLDDCVYHLICPFCTICQESRTLEMNNVQDGTWHGRGDTICVGSVTNRSNTILELHPQLPISTDTV